MLNPSLQEHTLSSSILVLTHTTEPFSLYVESLLMNHSPSMLNPSLQQHTLSPRVLVLTHTTEPFSLYVESFPTGTHRVSQGVDSHPHS